MAFIFLYKPVAPLYRMVAMYVATLERSNYLERRQTRLTMKTPSLMRKKVVPPSVFLKKAMPLSRQYLDPDWIMIPGARKRPSLGLSHQSSIVNCLHHPQRHYQYSEKIHRYWLNAAAPLAAIIEKTDAGEIDQDKAFQGIRISLV